MNKFFLYLFLLLLLGLTMFSFWRVSGVSPLQPLTQWWNDQEVTDRQKEASHLLDDLRKENGFLRRQVLTLTKQLKQLDLKTATLTQHLDRQKQQLNQQQQKLDQQQEKLKQPPSQQRIVQGVVKIKRSDQHWKLTNILSRQRTFSKEVIFKTPFKTAPKIMLSITTLDLGQLDVQMRLLAQSIKKDRFTLIYQTQSNTRIRETHVQWIAFSPSTP
ncbi:H-type lectin domain-containing protein [Magnetococcales bacterium HHB-1]